MSLQLSLVLGLIFGTIAAVLAFLIVYEAYRRHRLPARRLWRESLEAAVFAFVVFVILFVVTGYALRRVA